MAAIAIALTIYLKTRKLDDFEPKIKERLQELVKDGSRGLYHLDVEKVNVDLVASKIILSNLHLSYDSLRYATLIAQKMAPRDVFDIKLQSLAIDGLSAADLIARKNIDLKVLYANKPEISVYHHPSAVNTATKSKEGVYDLVRNKIGNLSIGKLELTDASLNYFHNISKLKTSFKKLKISLDDLRIDEESQYDTTRFLFARDAQIGLKDFRMKTADSIYNFMLDSITINAIRKRADVGRLRLQPRASKTAFRRLVKFRKDRYDIDIMKLRLDDIDWWELISEGNILAGKVQIGKADLGIYSDKAIPGDGKGKTGNYPHQQLFKMSSRLNIKEIRFKNTLITYSEFNVKTGKEGKIVFANTSAVVKNVTNIPEVYQKRPMLSIDAKSSFMNAGSLDAGFRFDLKNQKAGKFSVYARVGPMDATALNVATVGLASVKIERARLRSFRTDISGDNYRAHGLSYVSFEDLKISVLKADEGGVLKKRGLVSFIANNFKINKEYPPKGDLQHPIKSQFQRPADRSFFALLWKTIFNALKEPVGI